jgi:hypothetical protein
MSNKVGLTLKAKFDNGRSVSGGGAVFHSERARKQDHLNLKTEPNTITLYRHGLEQINKTDSKAVFGYFKDLEQSIKEDYQQHSHRNRKWQDKNELFYEGIIAFGREQFEQINNPQQVMDYCVKFADTLEQKTGAKIHMVSLHLDEGHLDDAGILQHNYHAHFLLVNYNQTIHKSALRNARMLVEEYKTEIKTYTNKAGETKQKTIKSKESTGNQIEALYDFKQIQNDLGQHFAGLGFTRGRDYAAEGLKCPKNIDYKQYSGIKAQEQEMRKSLIQDIENELEPINELGERLNIEFDSGKSFVDGINSNVLDPVNALNKHINPETAKNLKSITQLTEEISKEFEAKNQKLEQLSIKDQIIADFKAQLTRKNLELGALKSIYDQTRKELIASKEATQPNYQELKQTYKALEEQLKSVVLKEITNAKQDGFELYERRLERENSNIAKRTLLKAIEKPVMPLILTNQISEPTLETLTKLLKIKQVIEEKPVIQEVIVKQEKVIEIPKYVEKIIEKRIEKPIIVSFDENQQLKVQLTKATFGAIEQTSKIRALERKVDLLESTTNSQQRDLERQQNAFTEIHNENLTLKSENRSLENAIERFLELGAMKGITEGAKTLLERFNAAIMTVKMTFSKNQELTQENNSLKTQITAQQEREQSQSMNHGYSRGGGGMSL